jgi:AraC-like DNA-binding protein
LGDRSWTALQRYLDSHLGGAIRLEAMARAACVSRFHFARRFRARAGTSPMDYVITRRIEMAKDKLTRAETTICAVAHHLGFFDQSHFCRTFGRRVGVTPGEYRTRTAAYPTKE